jgi:toxin ParE1/3/4
MRMRVTRAARNDLLAIGKWLSERDPVAARSTLETLRQRINMLSQHPEIGRKRIDLAPELHAFVVRPYLILYRLEEDTLNVVRIIDGRRDLAKLFAN